MATTQIPDGQQHGPPGASLQEAVGDVLAVSQGTATVAVDTDTGCARCAAGRGCGAALVIGTPRRRRLELEIPAGVTLAPGDRVVLQLSPHRLLKAALTVYGLPLAALLAVPALASALWGPLGDAALALLAVLALAAAVAAGRRLAATGCQRQQLPSIGGRLPRAEGIDGR